MEKVNIQALKENFPRYLKILKKGMKVILCYRNQEVGIISPVQETKPVKRDPPGSLKHLLKSFDAEKFNTTDPELVDEFYK